VVVVPELSNSEWSNEQLTLEMSMRALAGGQSELHAEGRWVPTKQTQIASDQEDVMSWTVKRMD